MNGEGARCPVHNLSLNPQGECVLCRRAAQKPGQPASAKLFVGLLAVGVLAVLGWGLTGGFGGKRTGDQPRSAGAVSDEGEAEASERSVDDFVGTWTSRSCAGTFYTTFHADGTYSGYLIRKGTSSRSPIPAGSWELRDNSLVWIHGFSTSRTQRGEEDINEILHFSEDTFTLRETNGAPTRFERVR